MSQYYQQFPSQDALPGGAVSNSTMVMTRPAESAQGRGWARSAVILGVLWLAGLLTIINDIAHTSADPSNPSRHALMAAGVLILAHICGGVVALGFIGGGAAVLKGYNFGRRVLTFCSATAVALSMTSLCSIAHMVTDHSFLAAVASETMHRSSTWQYSPADVYASTHAAAWLFIGLFGAWTVVQVVYCSMLCANMASRRPQVSPAPTWR